MDNEQVIIGYLEIIARQMEFLCQTHYLELTKGNPDATPLPEIYKQEIYYDLDEPENR
jgi:hypothetical protein